MSSRREFLRGLFGGRKEETAVPAAPSAEEPEDSPERVLAKAYGALTGVSAEDLEEDPQDETPNYESMLPPDFTPALLRMEAERLGLDADSMSRSELAKAVLEAMNAVRPEEEEEKSGEDEHCA